MRRLFGCLPVGIIHKENAEIVRVIQAPTSSLQGKGWTGRGFTTTGQGIMMQR
jgi:hypothetical protein